MGAVLSITIPGIPVAKGRPRLSTINGQARAFTPAKTRKYEDLIRQAGADAMAGRDLLEGALAVEVRAYVAMPNALKGAKRLAAIEGSLRPTTRPDVDNYAKVIDGLNGVAWHDDKQVVTLVVTKHYSERPRLELSVEEMAA